MVLGDRVGDRAYLAKQVDTFSGGGGLLSTASDYLKFAEMLRRGGEGDGERLLSPHTLWLMTRNHLDGDLASLGSRTWCETPFQGVGFGLGFAVMLNPSRAQMSGGVGTSDGAAWPARCSGSIHRRI